VLCVLFVCRSQVALVTDHSTPVVGREASRTLQPNEKVIVVSDNKRPTVRIDWRVCACVLCGWQSSAIARNAVCVDCCISVTSNVTIYSQRFGSWL
jgi:hypothetical protein